MSSYFDGDDDDIDYNDIKKKKLGDDESDVDEDVKDDEEEEEEDDDIEENDIDDDIDGYDEEDLDGYDEDASEKSKSAEGGINPTARGFAFQQKGGATEEKTKSSSKTNSKQKQSQLRQIPVKSSQMPRFYEDVESTNDDDNNDDNDDDDDDGMNYLQKFDREINQNYLVKMHPECVKHNYDEILAMTKVLRDRNNMIVDDLHRTLPYLTKYEKACVLGQRAKQIEAGAQPFVKVPENIIDGYLIAEMELQQKRLPFIIRRPLPNGGSEYWKLGDLENISF